MHTIARESLQHFLYAYKESPKEQGLRLVHDAKKSQALRREREYQRALQNLRAAVKLKVAFAVRANAAYDGALEDESPIQKKTISFKKGAVSPHLQERYTHDWWIGRVVAAETTIGFIPTARRLARLTEQHEDEPEKSVDKNTM
ncbi:hypothetical protein OSTOST_21104, partial [Ostertagia ostertagi]